VATSNAFAVGPEFDVQAQLNANKIAVRWRLVSGNPYSRAWVGLFDKTKPNTQYIAWFNASRSEGDVMFEAPIKPAQYEVRFFPIRTYVHAAVSPTVIVEGADSMSAVVDNGCVKVVVNAVTFEPFAGAWVGLFPVTERDNRLWTRYQKLKAPKCELVFQPSHSPKLPGRYEARLFANGTYDVLLSAQFDVAAAVPAAST